MTLIPNWKKVLLEAWSIWAATGIIVFSAFSMALPFLQTGLQISQQTGSMITGLLGVAVWILRIVDQHLGITPPNV